MSELDRMQTWMRHVLRHPDGVEAGARAAPAAGLDPAAAEALEATITPSQRMSAPERLDVYARLLSGAARAALTKVYPGVHAALGAEAFVRLAREHARRRPSTVRCMQHWGLDLDLTLSELLDDPVPDTLLRLDGRDPPRDLLVQLARLEAAAQRLQWAPHEDAMDVETVRALPPDRLLAGSFRFVPALDLRRCDHPLGRYLDDLGSRESEEEASVHELRSGAEWVLLSRAEWHVRRHRLDDAAGRLLRALMDGRSLAEGLEGLLAEGGVEAESLMASLGGWFEVFGKARVFAAFEEPAGQGAS